MKLQVIVDDEVVQRIDREAKKRGLSRSAYCAQAILLELSQSVEKAAERPTAEGRP